MKGFNATFFPFLKTRKKNWRNEWMNDRRETRPKLSQWIVLIFGNFYHLFIFPLLIFLVCHIRSMQSYHTNNIMIKTKVDLCWNKTVHFKLTAKTFNFFSFLNPMLLSNLLHLPLQKSLSDWSYTGSRTSSIAVLPLKGKKEEVVVLKEVQR